MRLNVTLSFYVRSARWWTCSDLTKMLKLNWNKLRLEFLKRETRNIFQSAFGNSANTLSSQHPPLDTKFVSPTCLQIGETLGKSGHNRPHCQKWGINQDKRIVLTLDAGGTNFVFNAVRGGKELLDPIRLPSEGVWLFVCAPRIYLCFSR